MARQPNGHGSISLRKDGRWQIRLQVSRVRKYVYASSLREARSKLLELQREAGRGGFSRFGAMTVNDLLDLWLRTASQSLRPSTICWYETLAATHIRPTLGSLKLARLEPCRLQELYAEKRGRIAQAVHRVMHRACKLGVVWGWLGSNPAERVLAPTYGAPRKDLWTMPQLKQFLDNTADHWLSPLWIVALASGCRLGELVALKWTDVDLETSSIRIRRNLQRVRRQWVESTPKTKAGDRVVTLPDLAIEALRKQRTRQTEWRVRAGNAWQENGLVFTGERGRPVHSATVGHAMARECVRLELPVMSPHALRHMHASLLLRQRLPVTAVAARLGHSRPSVTTSVYAHELGDGDRKAAEAIGRALTEL